MSIKETVPWDEYRLRWARKEWREIKQPLSLLVGLTYVCLTLALLALPIITVVVILALLNPALKSPVAISPMLLRAPPAVFLAAAAVIVAIRPRLFRLIARRHALDGWKVNDLKGEQ